MKDEFNKELVPGSIKSAMKSASAGSRDLWMVDPKKVKPIPGFNVRVRDDAYLEHIRRIADSIKVEGFYLDKPLSGYVANEEGEEVIYFYDGHSRHEAVLIAIQEGAEIHRIPVVITQAGTSMVDLTVALVKSNSGKPLTAYEIAEVMKRLSRFGWDVNQIAERLGYSTQYVDNLLLLAAAPKHIQDMVQDGRVAAGLAVEVIRGEGSNAVKALEEAASRASSEGKKRVTKRHIPGTTIKSVYKKHAEKMANAIENAVLDPAFDSLSPKTKELFLSISDMLDEARKKEWESKVQQQELDVEGDSSGSDAQDQESEEDNSN